MRASKLLRVALVASNVTSALLLGLAGLEWTIVDSFTPFVALPLFRAAGWLFMTSGVLAIAALLLRWRTEGLRAAGPVLVQAVAVVVVATVPFGEMTLAMDFRLNRGDREQVVELVRTGQLRAGGALVPLPPALAHVSRGGAISVFAAGERPTVLFYTFRGLLDHYAGFLYSAADEPPDPPDEIPWREVDRRDTHWWWVSR